MKTKILFSLLLVFLLISTSKQALAEKSVEENTRSQQIEAKRLDNRAKILADYLATFDSPLQNHAQDFIDAADKYQLDWRMLPAIAGVESTFGKFIPGGYNGWGWGVYGTQAIYFNSWKEAIFTIAKGLREGYLDKGLNDPYTINKVYAASPTWGSKVSFFMDDIQKFADKSLESKQETAKLDRTPIIAAVSGQLAIR